MKNDKPLLSICIPTFNRVDTLIDLLEQIIAQADDRVEIVISDNASTDSTKEAIDSVRDRFANITYFCWESNQGPDINFMKVVELASGEYCWLLGSDDGIEEGGIACLLENIASGEDILLLNLKECDSNLLPFDHHEWIDSNLESETFNFKTNNELTKFFNRVSPLMGLFLGYLSIIVVKKSSWDKVQFDKNFIGTFFSFVYVLFVMINCGARLKYIKAPLVLNRGYNDSMIQEFKHDAELKRMLLDVDAYILFSNLLNDENAKQAFLNIGKRNFTWFPLLKLRSYMDSNKWKLVKRKLIDMGCNKLLLNLIGISGILKVFVISALKLKKNVYPKKRLLPRKFH